MAVSEQDLADVLAGVSRVHLAVIRGLSQNHPRSAANIIRELRLEARLAQRDGSATLTSLPARYLLGLLEAKPPNAEESQKQPTRRGLFSFHHG
jgi:hypothetical protein